MTRFKKGKSGNPSGRPSGVPDKRSALRDLLAPHAEGLINKAVELALQGDSTALRLCLERIMAPIRAKDEPVCLDEFGISLKAQGQAILNAAITGQITPTEASTLMQALSVQARVIEAEETETRLAALEQKLQMSK